MCIIGNKIQFQLLKAVGEVRQAVTVTPEVPPPPDMSSLNLHGKCLAVVRLGLENHQIGSSV